MPESNGQYETIIGRDAKFKGELEFDKGVRVLGRFEGQVATKGDLHVAEGGRLNANVDAGNVQIDGQVKGNVKASGKVLLKASAKLEGDLQTARLEVAEGAVFVGNCRVGPQSNGASPPRPAENGKSAAKSGELPKEKAAAPNRK